MGDEISDNGASCPGLYPIRAVSSLTGVNPVTLRAWERRYGLVKPKRTPKGHRLYTEDDIEFVRRILALVDRGVAISQVRPLLGRPEVEVAAASPAQGGNDAWSAYHQRLRAAVSRLDPGGVESVHNETLSLYPEDLVIRRLLQPVLRELSEERFADPDAEVHWHFLRSALRQKLGARLHHAETHVGGPRLVLAGLPGETDDLDMAMLAMLICGAGYRTLSLGTDVPPEAVARAARSAQARGVVLFGDGDPAPSLLHTTLPSLVRRVAGPVLVAGRIGERRGEAIAQAGALVLPADGTEAVRMLAARLPR